MSNPTFLLAEQYLHIGSDMSVFVKPTKRSCHLRDVAASTAGKVGRWLCRL